MSFRNCINNALEEKKVTPAQAEELRRRMDAMEPELSLEYGPHAGDEAARRVFDQMRFDTLEARRRKLLMAQRGGELLKLQDAFRDFGGDANPPHFMELIVSDDGGKAGTSTVEQRYHAVRGQAHAKMAEAIQAFERNVLGSTRNKPLLDDVVRAAFGEDATPEAKVLAESWMQAAEFLRRRFNGAGGSVAKRENWGLPQSHDSLAVRKAGFESWREEIAPKLDRTQMLNRAGDRPLTDGEFELLLRDVYETIRTDGANKITPDGRAGGRSKATTRTGQRHLVFRSADDWMAYQRRFGEGDAFAAMTGHIEGMSRDIAAMEILGPNPQAGMRMLEQNATKWAAEQPDADKQKDRVRSAAKLMENTYNHFSGAVNVPVHGLFARGMRFTRNMLTSAQLGGAILSAAPTDAFTTAMAKSYAGLQVTRDWDELFQLLDFNNKRASGDAIRAGLIADGATQVMAAQARFLGEANATGWMARFTDGVLRVSGLSPWTQAMKWSFGMEFMGNLAARRGQSLAALRAGDEPDRFFAETLERYGLAGAWDEVRTTAPFEPETGAMFLRAEDIAARTDLPPARAQFLADRVLEMVQSETQFAVPSGTSKSKARLIGNTQAGTVQGELLRSTAMYKSFPVHISYLLATRTMERAATHGTASAAQYFGTMAIGLTLAGGLSVQLKELRAGRDPRPMTDLKFWQAASLQGGGLGIFGDFLFADQNRFGGGLAETIAGPVVGLGSDVLGITVGNANAALRGDDPRLGRDVSRFLGSYTPGGSLWFADLAYQRALLDQLQAATDPDADEYFQRQIRSRQRDYGNGFWWEPGEFGPHRTPDIAAAARTIE